VEFAVSGNAVRGFRGEVERYQDFLIHGQFDVMMNYAAQQWATDLVFPVIDRIPYRKILAPCGFSRLYAPRFRSYFEGLSDILRHYDHLVFHSSTYRDVQFTRQHGISHFTIIPNGASEEEFQQADPSFRERYGITPGVPLLLTVGSHTGVKGHRLTIEAFRRARIGRSVLLVIGNTSSRWGCIYDCRRLAWLTAASSRGRKRVLLLDPPRVAVVAAYHAADLFVFCSNIECSPIVLFEAMASKTAFLTLAAGNAAEITEWSGGGVVMPSMQRADGYTNARRDAVVQAIENLVSNDHKRLQLAEAGHSAWRQRFTWEKLAGDYERLYQAVDRRSGGQRASP
jgi:glycosyltransferase involved in cell wall biosynthesis